jgi:hypothetical protein
MPDFGCEAAPVLAGEVMGSGLVRMAPGDVAALRRCPGPIPDGWGAVPPSLLRHSDEQTIAATAAVFAGVAGLGRPREAFKGWGVVAASRFLGRASLAVALRNFTAEGVWGTSPHLIPHFALHSPAGTISLALGLHGPNVGAGGGRFSVAEGFLTALTWLSTGVVPGVWLVLSGWSPELIPERRVNAPPAGECQAVAIALVAGTAPVTRPIFRAVVGGETGEPSPGLDLPQLAGRLNDPAVAPARTIATDSNGRLRIELVHGTRCQG